jgi:outer membrane biosynthesis protein TonB
VPAGGAREAPPPAGAAPPTGSGAANAGGPPQPGAASGAPAPGRDSPRILQAAWPSRSVLAALKASGRLRYRLRVEADGRVSAWELLDAGGFDCAPCLREAERIIRELRFAPGTLDGRPVACWVPYEISFEKGGR